MQEKMTQERMTSRMMNFLGLRRIRSKFQKYFNVALVVYFLWECVHQEFVYIVTLSNWKGRDMISHITCM